MGCYGSPWARTPNLDRLAGEGVIFRSALTPAPVCVPARLSILTGRLPIETGVWANVTAPRTVQDHLTLRFREAGYRTATFGKQHYLAADRAFDTEQEAVLSEHVGHFGYREDHDESRYGVVKYPPQPYAWVFGGRFPAAAAERTEARVIRDAIRWLEQDGGDAPFLLRLSFNAPHTPVVPPEPFDSLINPDDVRIARETENMPDDAPMWIREWLAQYETAARLTSEQIRAMRGCYYGEVAFLDQQFGVLVEWMRERGLLDNTIIAYVSDHGTHLGDFGLVQKQTFYEPVVCVPFFFWYPPSVARGAMLGTPVSTRSLLPTVMELAGLELPPAMRGLSLAEDLRRGREPGPRPIFSEFTLESFVELDELPRDIRGHRLILVRDGDWKLSLRVGAEPCDGTLHNLRDDPCERKNLFGSPDFARVREHLTSLVDHHIAGAS